MLAQRHLRTLSLVLVFLMCALTAIAGDDKKHDKKKDKTKAEGAPVLWQEPADIASRNLLLGPGGEVMKPDLSSVTFIEEEKGGYSKKYRVSDAAGRIWIAKIGKESQSETAASRLLWAAGYNTDITYFVPSLTIEGKGTFENVRLEARPKEVKRLEEWQWDRNPFVGTRELQGLKIMMILLENWDIKDSNNRILLVRTDNGESEQRYIVSDLGGTLGKTGGVISRSRNKPADYVKAKFIDEVRGNRVDFHFSGKRKDLFRNITIEQARWIGEVLSRLSDDQLRDAFRAASYSNDQVEMLAQTVRSRINELVSLSADSASRQRQ